MAGWRVRSSNPYHSQVNVNNPVPRKRYSETGAERPHRLLISATMRAIHLTYVLIAQVIFTLTVLSISGYLITLQLDKAKGASTIVGAFLLGFPCGVGPRFAIILPAWGCSSVGRAPHLHCGCQEFKSPHLHPSVKQKPRAILAAFVYLPRLLFGNYGLARTF